MPQQAIPLRTSDLEFESRIAWRPILVAVAAVAIACLLAYYAWGLRGAQRATTAELAAAQAHVVNFDREHAALATCTDELKDQQRQCDAIERSVTTMRGDLTATKAEIESLRKQREQTAKRLAAFKELTGRFQKMIDSGKLDVIVRDGRMVVKLPAGVLFDSGSAELSRDGELALMEVAVVLRDLDGRKFMVEGHTDNRPLENVTTASRFQNNWELSTARAVTVVQFLVEARMEPANLLAAGHGEFDPVGNNNTASGRQENRRIEIILLPNVEEIPPLPE